MDAALTAEARMNTETNVATYLIAEFRMAQLAKKLDKLARKADRLGVSTITYAVTGHQDLEFYRDDNGETRRAKPLPLGKSSFLVRFNEVTVTGTTPRLSGWEFVATLQHLTDDKGQVINMLRTVPFFEGKLPEKYRTATSENCDHCHKNIRTRKDTFVVRNAETGEFKQIGRNCVADFIGGVNPHSVASALDLLLEVYGACSGEEGFEGMGGGRSEYRYGMDRFLTVTAMFVRSEGWTSRGKSRATDGQVPATADLVLEYLSPPPFDSVAAARHREFVAAHPITAEDEAVAEKAMTYAREELVKKADRSDYEHNLYVATMQPTVEYRTAGITASLIAYHLKEVERQVIRELELKKTGASQHIGTVGERLKMVVATVLRVNTTEGQFGTTYIVKLLTREGNVITWFASSNPELAPGKEYMLDGTVKKHSEYNGVKETVLTRCGTYTDAGRQEAEEKAARKAAREAKKAAKAAQQ
jgi:hypothetical protein